nr:unnamed protein product [Callosobruchus chinensis]CAH7762309.1 unnamed protein product [Callosobruchus chinensis]
MQSREGQFDSSMTRP